MLEILITKVKIEIRKGKKGLLHRNLLKHPIALFQSNEARKGFGIVLNKFSSFTKSGGSEIIELNQSEKPEKAEKMIESNLPDVIDVGIKRGIKWIHKFLSKKEFIKIQVPRSLQSPNMAIQSLQLPQEKQQKSEKSEKSEKGEKNEKSKEVAIATTRESISPEELAKQLSGQLKISSVMPQEKASKPFSIIEMRKTTGKSPEKSQTFYGEKSKGNIFLLKPSQKTKEKPNLSQDKNLHSSSYSVYAENKPILIFFRSRLASLEKAIEKDSYFKLQKPGHLIIDAGKKSASGVFFQ